MLTMLSLLQLRLNDYYYVTPTRSQLSARAQLMCVGTHHRSRLVHIVFESVFDWGSFHPICLDSLVLVMSDECKECDIQSYLFAHATHQQRK
jgi:hypothetical protein